MGARYTCLTFRYHASKECPGNLVNHGMVWNKDWLDLVGLFQYAMLGSGKSLMAALCPRPSEAALGVICMKSSDSSDKVPVSCQGSSASF